LSDRFNGDAGFPCKHGNELGQVWKRILPRVSGRLANMDLTLTGMSQSVYVLPEINETMNILGRSTYQMSSDMHNMVGDVSEMQTDVSSMTGRLDTMGRKVGGMNADVNDMTGSMRRMNGEMRQMSRPMDFFPLN
jgi:methyl-accepting chemotaxis protein